MMNFRREKQERITKAIMWTALALAFLVAALVAGCSKQTGTGSGDESDSESRLAFFQSSRDHEIGAPAEWTAVSDFVKGQIEETYKDQGIAIENLERSESGALAVHMVLTPDSGRGVHEQLLDGLFVLHETYPDQRIYMVELSGDSAQRVETDWEGLERLIEQGYSFETSGETAESYWQSVTNPGDGEVAPEEADGEPVGVQAGSQ